MHALLRPLSVILVALGSTGTLSAQFFTHSTTSSPQPVGWVTSLAVLQADSDGFQDLVLASSISS